MRNAALALVVALLLAVIPFAAASAGPAASPVAAAAKKKCKRGYVLKSVKTKKRIRGKVRTVTVKKCVKKKRPPQPQPQTQPPPAPPAGASCPASYTGRATGMDGVFQYGDVRIDRTCGEVTRVEIKSVSTQCNTSSFTFVVVFNPSSPDIGILEGSNQIVGDKMHVVYQPDKTSANQTTMDITFTGSTARGEFHSIGNCKQDGLFTANAG